MSFTSKKRNSLQSFFFFKIVVFSVTLCNVDALMQVFIFIYCLHFFWLLNASSKLYKKKKFSNVIWWCIVLWFNYSLLFANHSFLFFKIFKLSLSAPLHCCQNFKTFKPKFLSRSLKVQKSFYSTFV